MNIIEGQIVASKAGHDAGRFFAAVKISDGYIYLADGKERKLNNPKKKNIKHIAKTETVVKIPETDKQLRKLLNSFRRAILED